MGSPRPLVSRRWRVAVLAAAAAAVVVASVAAGAAAAGTAGADVGDGGTTSDTVACNGVWPPQRVPSAMVDDGLCDCCNCADEADGGSAVGVAGEGCEARAARLAAMAADAARAHNTGSQYATRRAFKPSVVRSIAGAFSSDIEMVRGHVARFKQEAQARWDAAGKPADPRTVLPPGDPFWHWQRLLGEAMQRLRLLQLQKSAGFSPRVLPLLLSDACAVSGPVSEKISKGGSTTSVPKTYIYAACFGQNVTQVELWPDEWTRRDEATKHVPLGASATVVRNTTETADIVMVAAMVGADGAMGEALHVRNRTFGPPVLVGLWAGFIPQRHLHGHFDDHIPVFAGVRGSVMGSAAAEIGDREHSTDDDGDDADEGHGDAWQRRRRRREARMLKAGGKDFGGAMRAGNGTGTVDWGRRFAMLYRNEADVCVSEGIRTTRRAYVLHVCPGLTPEQEAALAEVAPSLPPDLRARIQPVMTPMNDRFAYVRRGAVPRLAQNNPMVPMVVDVAEDGLCTYKITVTAPPACVRGVGATLQRVSKWISGGAAAAATGAAPDGHEAADHVGNDDAGSGDAA